VVYYIASGHSLVCVVVLSGVVFQMVRWGVGWLSKLRDLMEVFHGGGVARAICSLMYEDRTLLELGGFLMFFPW